ncbi:MAG TPA: hypothetical protein VFO91_19325 [Anaerolineales bacterium]|nr:hypothetical protein [Anaerolineales bacterium]
MSTNNGNFIRPGKHGSQVVLDPDFLICHPLYMPDGQTMSKSNMTLGQAIEAIALAHIRARMPHLAEKCNAAKIEFKDGKFVVCFADNIDNLSF